MNIPTLAIFGIVGWMIVTFNDAKTYTFIKGLKWVTVCADRYGNMIICPKGSNYCGVNTCISTTDNEKTLSSFLQCLNGSQVLKFHNFTSSYPCNCNQKVSNKPEQYNKTVQQIQVMTVTMDEI
ncbi:hypothetical protein GWI33_005479 [Rhynchophorus ferrugineus]|uniref:Uncharacterized protein n=1 Tax=Rhynchophorus ferrugineus TaxID=354439 RepID=A0A834IHE5_RHYFE|nr:hypothetical protein GWI33_005479 [Rhynchophorus ferrugineus]